jgi:hypothetical protein
MTSAASMSRNNNPIQVGAVRVGRRYPLVKRAGCVLMAMHMGRLSCTLIECPSETHGPPAPS